MMRIKKSRKTTKIFEIRKLQSKIHKQIFNHYIIIDKIY